MTLSIETRTVSPSRHVVIPPSSCLSNLQRRTTWTEPTVYATRHFDLGVRSNDPEFDALLGSLLAPMRTDVTHDQPNFSIELHERDASGPRGMHLLFRSWRNVARARSRVGIVQALLDNLEFTPSALRRVTDHVVVNSIAIVDCSGARPPSASLIDDASVDSVLTATTQLRRLGLRPVNTMSTLLGLGTGQIVVERPQVPLVEAVVKSLREADREADIAADEPVPSGSYPIAAWIVRDLTAGRRDVRPAEALMRAGTNAQNRKALDADIMLATLRSVVTDTRMVAGVEDSPRAVLTAATELVGQ
jgi:hypothetical protein